MADKSVIQMAEDEHFRYGDECCNIGLRLEEASRREPTTAEEVEAYGLGFTAGWRMATRSIQRNGNCRFEDERG